MGTETLVDNQIEDGRKLLNLLVERGFEVTVAGWARRLDDGIWNLYVATKRVDDDGLFAAYMEFNRIFRLTSDAWVSDSDITLIGKESPIAKDLAELARKYTGWVAIRSYRLKLGPMAVDAVYVYPPPISLRQLYSVRYRRNDEANSWRATTKRGELFRNMKAKGAVAYTTGFWEGESKEDQTSATVTVLLEIDPRFDDKDALDDPGVWQVLESQARMIADEMFKTRHPDALITNQEHVDVV